MTHTLSAYVDAPGRLVGAAPYRSDGAVLWGAFLKGARQAQQDACERLLNAPCAGALRFHVVSNTLLYAALLAERTSSLHPRDAHRGAMRERDIGFWSLVIGGPRGDFLKWRLYWLPHFLFVDSASAMASGREVYGYFKDIGAFAFTGAPRDDPRVVISVEHMAHFDPHGVSAAGPLVRLDGPAPAPPHLGSFDNFALEAGIGGPFSHGAAGDAPFADALDDAIVDAIAADVQNTPALSFAPVAAHDGRNAVDAQAVRGHLGGLLAHLKPPRMGLPTILLKQIPDVEQALSAAHQSIVAVEPVAETVRSMTTLRGAYAVTLEASDSHPIARTLGLGPRSPVSWLFRVDMDFTVPVGKTLWRA